MPANETVEFLFSKKTVKKFAKIKPQNAFLREIWGSFLLKYYFYALSAQKFKPEIFIFE